MTEKGVYCFFAFLFGVIAGCLAIQNARLHNDNQVLQQIIEEGHYCVSTCVEMFEEMGC